MEQYVIKGGKPLEGEVVIAGAKNAALGILAATVMTDDVCIIENVPFVSDTRTLLKAIENIGATVEYLDRHTVKICAGGIHSDENLSVDDLSHLNLTRVICSEQVEHKVVELPCLYFHQ